ncbi:NepR family anti-sigma factor [Sphingobium mellinum]|uniref:NepR family anti-sigma factor n=1 Tax=Sphingobium mellinum TaxID=1387166 RepID=UPI0030ECD482
MKGGDKKDVGANTPDSGAKSDAGRRRRKAAAKDEAHVSNALRSVYQRAVDEEIPSEMLDLLRKLD